MKMSPFVYRITCEGSDKFFTGALWAESPKSAASTLLALMNESFNKGKMEDAKVARGVSSYTMTAVGKIDKAQKKAGEISCVVEEAVPFEKSPLKVGKSGKTYLVFIYGEDMAIDYPVVSRSGKGHQKAAEAVLKWFGFKANGKFKKVTDDGSTFFEAPIHPVAWKKYCGVKKDGQPVVRVSEVEFGNADDTPSGFNIETWEMKKSSKADKPAKKKEKTTKSTKKKEKPTKPSKTDKPAKPAKPAKPSKADKARKAKKGK